MTPELIAILGVGVALASILLATRRDINTRLDRLETRIDQMDGRLKTVELGQARLEGLVDQLDGRLKTVELGQAKLEGLLEGLREAIAGRRPAGTAA